MSAEAARDELRIQLQNEPWFADVSIAGPEDRQRLDLWVADLPKEHSAIPAYSSGYLVLARLVANRELHEQSALIERWEAAHKAKDFKVADPLRAELLKCGIQVSAKNGIFAWTKINDQSFD